MNSIGNMEILKRYLEANNLNFILLKSKFLHDLFDEHRFINDGYFYINFDENLNELTSCIDTYYHQGFYKTMSNFRIENDSLGYKITEFFKWNSLDSASKKEEHPSIIYKARVTTYFLNEHGKFIKSHIREFRKDSQESLDNEIKINYPYNKNNFKLCLLKPKLNIRNRINQFIQSLILKAL